MNRAPGSTPVCKTVASAMSTSPDPVFTETRTVNGEECTVSARIEGSGDNAAFRYVATNTRTADTVSIAVQHTQLRGLLSRRKGSAEAVSLLGSVDLLRGTPSDQACRLHREVVTALELAARLPSAVLPAPPTGSGAAPAVPLGSAGKARRRVAPRTARPVASDESSTDDDMPVADVLTVGTPISAAGAAQPAAAAASPPSAVVVAKKLGLSFRETRSIDGMCGCRPS